VYKSDFARYSLRPAHLLNLHSRERFPFRLNITRGNSVLPSPPHPPPLSLLAFCPLPFFSLFLSLFTTPRYRHARPAAQQGASISYYSPSPLSSLDQPLPASPALLTADRPVINAPPSCSQTSTISIFLLWPSSTLRPLFFACFRGSFSSFRRHQHLGLAPMNTASLERSGTSGRYNGEKFDGNVTRCESATSSRLPATPAGFLEDLHLHSVCGIFK